MKIVLAKPFNDESIVEPYLVQHNSKKTETAFEKAFEKYLNEVKKANPETWNLDQVFTKLESDGWQIIRLESITVTY